MKKIFIEAHKMTGEIVKEYEVDYQAQFGLCLSYLLEKKEEKEMLNKIETVEDVKQIIKKNMDLVEDEKNFDIVNFEMNEWENYGKHRIYFNISINTEGNTVRNADGYIDAKTMKVFSTKVDKRRYNENTIESIYETIVNNIEDIVKVIA